MSSGRHAHHRRRFRTQGHERPPEAMTESSQIPQGQRLLMEVARGMRGVGPTGEGIPHSPLSNRGSVVEGEADPRSKTSSPCAAPTAHATGQRYGQERFSSLAAVESARSTPQERGPVHDVAFHPIVLAQVTYSRLGPQHCDQPVLHRRRFVEHELSTWNMTYMTVVRYKSQ